MRYRVKYSLITAMALCAAWGLTSGAAEEGASIEIAYNLASEDFSVFEQIVNDFSAESGVEVKIYNGGDDYESAMKTRMASNDLPDMWVTHGWSLLRYSEYMMDLSDQDWVSDIDTGLKEVITNDDGELFILPITQAVVGIMYDKDVLEAAGVDPSSIRTWDDFDAACAAIKENTDASPIEICFANSYDAYVLEDILPSMLTNEDLSVNYAEALKDGSFDWETNGSEALQMMADWYNAGYFNEDLASCQREDVCQAFANDEAGFSLNSTNLIPSVLAYNTDANIGIIPVPSYESEGASYFGVGEGNYSCFGIYKDTAFPEACKAFLEYLSQPEISKKIVQIDGGIPALNTIELSEGDEAAYTTNEFKAAQSSFENDLTYDNFFDREYLPSGMWSVMKDAVSTLLADGDPEAYLEDSLSLLADNYADLMGN